MAFKYFKYFEKDGIADGATYEDDWTPETDITLKRIHIARKDGVGLTKSTFYMTIAEYVYTHEVVPASILGPDKLTSPELNIAVKAKAKIKFTFKNLEGASIDIMITMECWE